MTKFFAKISGAVCAFCCIVPLLAVPSAYAGSVEACPATVGEVTDDRDVLFFFLDKLQRLDGYVVQTTGETVAKKVVTYRQNLSSTVMKKGEEYYQSNKSHSLFVSTDHQALFCGEKAAYRNNGGDVVACAKGEYRREYGATPTEYGGLGIDITEKTLLSANKRKEGDVYACRFLLDGNACGGMKQMMKKFGNLKEFPTFRDVCVTLWIKDDWTPVRFTLDADYTVSLAVLGTVSCKEHLTSVFREINGNVVIPDHDLLYGAMR